MGKALKFNSLLYVILTAACWGPSYLFIKIAVQHIPPITLVLIRVTVGALILGFACSLRKMALLHLLKQWKHLLVLAIAFTTVPYCLISYGELYITSSLAGVLMSLTVIFTAILAHYFLQGEAFTRNKIIGIISGTVGLIIIYLPFLLKRGDNQELGAFLIVLACLSYAIGTVYARTKVNNATSKIPVLTVQFIFSALILLPFALLVDHPFTGPAYPHNAMIAALCLGTIGTAGGFYFFYKAIQVAGATYASFALLFVPIVAMALGYIFLGESMTWNMLLGTLFILFGVLFVNPALSEK